MADTVWKYTLDQQEVFPRDVEIILDRRKRTLKKMNRTIREIKANRRKRK